MEVFFRSVTSDLQPNIGCDTVGNILLETDFGGNGKVDAVLEKTIINIYKFKHACSEEALRVIFTCRDTGHFQLNVLSNLHPSPSLEEKMVTTISIFIRLAQLLLTEYLIFNN